MSVKISGPAPGDSGACERILRALPQWFGIEKAILQYSRDVAKMPTFTATDGGQAIGFLSLREHFPEAAEIHVMAVGPQWRGRGIGKSLLAGAEGWLKARGSRFLQVKTVSGSSDDPNYAATRAFYLKTGFVPLEEFPTLWSEANPCLLLVKGL